MDGYQHACRDLVLVRYALCTILLVMAIMFESTTRDIGSRNAILELGSQTIRGVVTEIERWGHADTIVYQYRPDLGKPAYQAAFRFEHWRKQLGHPGYEYDEIVTIAYSTIWDSVSFPEAERDNTKVDMAIWLAALAGGLFLTLFIVWNAVTHCRFLRYLRKN